MSRERAIREAQRFASQAVMPFLGGHGAFLINREDCEHRVKYHGSHTASVDEIQAAVTERLSAEQRISLYAHMPICRYRCRFCHYPVVVEANPDRSPAKISDFVGRLIDEASILGTYFPSLPEKEVSSLYLGGGTPMLMSEHGLRILIGDLPQQFGITDQTEISIEGTPETYTPEKIILLRELGINRVSVGVQTTNDAILALQNRHHTTDQSEDTVRQLVQAGVPEVNVDLIYGFPGQSFEQFYDDLRWTVRLNPSAITIYRLRVHRDDEMKTATAVEFARSPEIFPGLESLYGMQYLAKQVLTEAGYVEGPSGWFTRSGSSPQVYRDRWTDQIPLFGLGWNTYSYSSRYEFYNLKDVGEHRKAVQEQRLPIQGGAIYDETEQALRWIFFQLKSRFAVSLADCEARFGEEVPNPIVNLLLQLQQEGLATTRQEGWYLTELGQVLVEEIIK